MAQHARVLFQILHQKHVPAGGGGEVAALGCGHTQAHSARVLGDSDRDEAIEPKFMVQTH